jgi:hypothetical protein
MPLRTIKVWETFKAVWKLYGKCSLALLKLVLPLLALAEVVNLIAGQLNAASAIGLGMVAWGISTFANIKALKLFLNQAGYQTEAPTSLPVFFFFLFVTFYIGLASSLAGIAFIIPALLVYASAILTPALIVGQGRGPFEGIAESVEQTRANVWRISGLLLSIWVPLLILNAIFGAMNSAAGPASQAIGFLLSTGAAFLGLLNYAATAVVYVELQPNISLQGDAPQAARP